MTADQPTADATEPAWVRDVLDFWFLKTGARHWFSRDAAIDAEIRERFLSLYERIVTGELQGFTTPRAVLAAVIVLDQFPRNMFRDSPRAFAGDAMARHLARAAVDRQLDAGLADEERLFLYLPFEHSEDRGDQALSCELFGRLGNEQWTQYAQEHRDIVDRFGRFPHRNAALGRMSTAAEAKFLQGPNSSF